MSWSRGGNEAPESAGWDAVKLGRAVAPIVATVVESCAGSDFARVFILHPRWKANCPRSQYELYEH